MFEATAAVISWYAISSACFCSGVRTATQAWNTSGFDSICLTIANIRDASGFDVGTTSL